MWDSLSFESRDVAEILINAKSSLARLSRIRSNHHHVVSSLSRAPANVFLIKDKQVIVKEFCCTHTKISTLQYTTATLWIIVSALYLRSCHTCLPFTVAL